MIGVEGRGRKNGSEGGGVRKMDMTVGINEDDRIEEGREWEENVPLQVIVVRKGGMCGCEGRLKKRLGEDPKMSLKG